VRGGLANPYHYGVDVAPDPGGRVGFAHKENVEGVRAAKQPDGQITKSMSSPSAKNIFVAPSGKSEV